MPPRQSPTLPSAVPAAGRNLSAMRAAGVFGGGNDVAAERLGLAERKFANDVNHQAEVARAKAEDQRIARENLAIRQFMEPIRAQEAAANFARKMLDMKNELNGRHQLVNFNLALDELDPRDPDYETQVAQLRLSPQFSDIPHVKGADDAIEKYVAMTAKSRDVYAPLRKSGIDLEQFTVRGPRGEFMGFKLREAQNAVLTKARNLATLPGESVSLGKDGEVQYRKSVPAIPPYNREKAEAAAAAAKEKADAAARRFVAKEKLKGINISLDDLYDTTKTKGKSKEKIADEKRQLLAERDRLLDSIYDETPDQPAPDESPAPPVPKEVPKKTPEQPVPPTTGAAPIIPALPTTGTPPASITPPAPTKRIPFKDRLKEPPSQPQASAAPDMDTLTASASDFSRFSGRREEIDSDPDLNAEFNAASESMSQTLQSLGYDEDAAAASGGYVADGSTIEFEQGEDGEPVAVTVDPDGARTPLKKAASEAVASIDSSSTAS